MYVSTSLNSDLYFTTQSLQLIPSKDFVSLVDSSFTILNPQITDNKLNNFRDNFFFPSDNVNAVNSTTITNNPYAKDSTKDSNLSYE